MKRYYIKLFTLAGLLLFSSLLPQISAIYAQWGPYPLYMMPDINDTSEDLFRKTVMRLNWDKEQQDKYRQWEAEMQIQLNEDYSDPHYYADLELMMQDLKIDVEFQQELNKQDHTYDAYVEPQMQLDPARLTYLNLIKNSMNNYHMPNCNTITINGVSSTPGLETGGGTVPRSSGHVTMNQLNRQITREAKSYEAYKKHPSGTSYLYWKSNQKLTQTYQRCLKH